ncbi:MAG: DUF2851 family protein [Candidatus Marinimicrobia bacterium]|nr:DUF2851 family protein [Candidatus Neomarinimicrobiota bacterium]MCF7830357.1 DUF2851 family protein [Candidatus Neomarinimicrobiota bacterium]MCF7882453.1 DUF2851 family protein [Candidatus Neomarinimicrobiota bacterium]
MHTPYAISASFPGIVREQTEMYVNTDPPQESLLQAYWKNLRFPCEFETSTGQSITVLHGGSHNLNAGPDFTHAIVQVNGIIRQGDIEVHRYSSGWKRHGHSGDPRFHNVILHVVSRDNFTPPEAGNPDYPEYTVEMNPPAEELRFPARQERCRNHALQPDAISYIREKGMIRLRKRSARFAERINTEESPEHLWYRMTLRCLGYGANSREMEQALSDIPPDMMTEVTIHLPPEALFQVALGLTGYHRYYEVEVPAWDSVRSKFGFEGRPYYRWHPLRSRPRNHPVLRLFSFLSQHRNWYKLFATDFVTIEATEFIQQMMHRVTIPEIYTEYFGTRDASLGQSRAVELLMNSWIPLRMATGKVGTDAAVSDWIGDLPAIPIYGKIRRFIHRTRWQEFIPGGRRLHPILLQGFLALRDELCEPERCDACRAIAGEEER